MSDLLLQNSQSVLTTYESVLRATAVRFLSDDDIASGIEPTNAEEQLQADTPQRTSKPSVKGRARILSILDLKDFEDCTRFKAKVRMVVYSLQRSLLGYYVDCSSSSSAGKSPE
jgi:hypothetical protein